MPQAPIRLDQDFLSVLTLADFDNFTVLEMRAAYLALPNNRHLDKNQAQRIVYRQIIRLQRNGLLTRVESKKTGKSRYQKTELFFAAEFLPLVTQNDPESNEDQDDDPLFFKHLIGKLQHYKLELLSSMGESEEYKTLYSEFPQLKSQLQEKYNKARDHSSKLLGRVKAIETLIEQQNGQRAP